MAVQTVDFSQPPSVLNISGTEKEKAPFGQKSQKKVIELRTGDDSSSNDGLK